MKLRMAVAIFVVTLAASVMTVAAHHSVKGTFDASKEIRIRGAVTKIDWTNPHVRFWVDARNNDGTVSTWELELPPPNAMRRNLGVGFHQTRRSGHHRSLTGKGRVQVGQHAHSHGSRRARRLQLLSRHNDRLGNDYEFQSRPDLHNGS